jgi:hypothetical protein
MNLWAKMVKKENAYLVIDGGGMTWYVLKAYQRRTQEKNNPFARWFCYVKSEFSESSDVYVRDIPCDCLTRVALETREKEENRLDGLKPRAPRAPKDRSMSDRFDDLTKRILGECSDTDYAHFFNATKCAAILREEFGTKARKLAETLFPHEEGLGPDPRTDWAYRLLTEGFGKKE